MRSNKSNCKTVKLIDVELQTKGETDYGEIG
jgi:hypothetical protein